MEIETTAIVINRVSGGKVVEEWSESTGVLEAHANVWSKRGSGESA